MASWEKSSSLSFHRLSPRKEANKGLVRRRYSHCSARRSFRAFRRASNPGAACAALAATQTRRTKPERQIRFASEGIRLLTKCAVRALEVGIYTLIARSRHDPTVFIRCTSSIEQSSQITGLERSRPRGGTL